ncbi:hypothetical protein ACFL4G_05810 [Thermodesulfobacteriota bacterium]
MNSFAVALVLFSTFMHAGWNLLARGKGREGTFFLRMLIVSCAAGFVPAVVSEALTRSIPPDAWFCVVGAGTCCGFYYLFLARSYASSDFTVVYPLARALPVLMVGSGDVLRGNLPTAEGWIGMLLVVAGCMFAPLSSFREISPRRYWNRTSLWLVLTALGTFGYTMLDKIASESVCAGPATAARYGYFFFLTSLVVYAAGRRLFETRNNGEKPIGWSIPALASILNFGAYWLVLWAYQLGRHAGYIVAFRQFSIVIGVVIAFVLFKEKGRRVRLTGTALITAGLIFIALWGT